MEKFKVKDYWYSKFNGLKLNFDYPFIKKVRSDEKQLLFKKATIQLNKNSTDKLLALSKNSDLGLYILMLTGLKITLSKYTEQSEIIVGITPLNGNNLQNILPIKSDVKSKALVRDYINILKSELGKDLNFQI